MFFPFFRININHTVNHFTGTQFFDQLACTIDRCLCIVRVQTLFKFTLGIGTHTELFTGKTDIRAVKAGRFKEHRLNVVCDHGVFTAHDTCDTNRFFTITDSQHRIIHLMTLAVQCHKFLTIDEATNHDLMIFNRIQVIGMHRLSIFFHDIVRNINDIVDRTDAIGRETALHPFR